MVWKVNKNNFDPLLQNNSIKTDYPQGDSM